MKRVLYALPAVVYCGAVIASGMRLGVDGSLKPITWIYMLLLLSAAVLLCFHRWWGSLPGIAVGAVIIYLFEHSHVHHHIDETPVGLAVVAYYILMGLICYRSQTKEKRGLA